MNQAELQDRSLQPSITDITTKLARFVPNDVNFERYKETVVPGVVITNEKYNPELIEKVKLEYSPSGYIYGAGAGNIFTLIETFPNETPPKGILMVDIDPGVILVAKALIEGFASYSDWITFSKEVLFGWDIDLEKIIDGEKNDGLREAMRINQQRALDGIRNVRYQMSLSFKGYSIDWATFPFDDDLAFLKDEVVPVAVIARRYELLHRMALENRLIPIWANMFDPEVIKQVAKLPDIKDSNNLIYYSNIPTVATSVEYEEAEENQTPEKWIDTLNNRFKNLDFSNPNAPHKNIYIGVIPKQQFKLEAQTSSPRYSRKSLEI